MFSANSVLTRYFPTSESSFRCASSDVYAIILGEKSLKTRPREKERKREKGDFSWKYRLVDWKRFSYGKSAANWIVFRGTAIIGAAPNFPFEDSFNERQNLARSTISTIGWKWGFETSLGVDCDETEREKERGDRIGESWKAWKKARATSTKQMISSGNDWSIKNVSIDLKTWW